MFVRLLLENVDRLFVVRGLIRVCNLLKIVVVLVMDICCLVMICVNLVKLVVCWCNGMFFEMLVIGCRCGLVVIKVVRLVCILLFVFIGFIVEFCGVLVLCRVNGVIGMIFLFILC